MAIELNHTIVPAKDKVASAEFFARIFGLPYEGAVAHFAPVRVNDSLTFDFDDREDFDSHHYAFKVSEEDFDAVFERLQNEGIPYGSGPPPNVDNMKINRRSGGRGVYFSDPNGHVLELLTVG